MSLLAQHKFSTDQEHAQELDSLLMQLRGAAKAARMDGHPLGGPTFVDFLEQLSRLKSAAAPGNDLLPAMAWRHAPRPNPSPLSARRDKNCGDASRPTWRTLSAAGNRILHPRNSRQCLAFGRFGAPSIGARGRVRSNSFAAQHQRPRASLLVASGIGRGSGAHAPPPPNRATIHTGGFTTTPCLDEYAIWASIVLWTSVRSVW